MTQPIVLTPNTLKVMRNNVHSERVQRQQEILKLSYQQDVISRQFNEFVTSLQHHFPTIPMVFMSLMDQAEAFRDVSLESYTEAIPKKYTPEESAFEVLSGRSVLGNRAREYCTLLEETFFKDLPDPTKLVNMPTEEYGRLFVYGVVKINNLTPLDSYNLDELKKLAEAAIALNKLISARINKTLLFVGFNNGKAVSGTLLLDSQHNQFRWAYHSTGEDLFIDCTDTCVIPSTIRLMADCIVTNLYNRGYYPNIGNTQSAGIEQLKQKFEETVTCAKLIELIDKYHKTANYHNVGGFIYDTYRVSFNGIALVAYDIKTSTQIHIRYPEGYRRDVEFYKKNPTPFTISIKIGHHKSFVICLNEYPTDYNPSFATELVESNGGIIEELITQYYMRTMIDFFTNFNPTPETVKHSSEL